MTNIPSDPPAIDSAQEVLRGLSVLFEIAAGLVGYREAIALVFGVDDVPEGIERGFPRPPDPLDVTPFDRALLAAIASQMRLRQARIEYDTEAPDVP